jgi:hypothetical protein
MKRTALVLVPLVAVAATAATAVAAPPKPKPKPITKTYTATATPDPTSSNVGEICEPQVNPTARHSEPFKVPAAGTLLVKMANTLDWSLAVRQGGDLVASSDGATPETVEQVSVKFKKATSITIDSCNFAGEPSVDVTYTFTYK